MKKQSYIFLGILSYFIKPFFTKNWRGCGTLLLGEGSNAFKPFYGYIKYFKAFSITKDTIFEMGSGAKPQQKFFTLHIEILRTLRHLFFRMFKFYFNLKHNWLARLFDQYI